MESVMEKYFNDIVKTTSEIIRFDSSLKPADGEYPFGKEAAECLEYFLNLASDMGFETHNYENFVGEVIFGDNVRIGPDCTFSTPHHPVDPQKRLEGWQIHKSIHVGDNVWFGSSVNVLPGVSIGSNTVIGAGSVVTRDIPSGVFAAGNPCRVIKKVEE